QRGGRSGRVHRDQVMPPIFKQTIQPLEINVGGHAKLECEIEDAPSVTFKWFKSGVEIRQGDKYRILSSHIVSSLEVLNPIKADSGDYTCKASNQPQWGVFLSNPLCYPDNCQRFVKSRFLFHHSQFSAVKGHFVL
uniref:Ig-like domain-containing protein n=1 Tax=Cynoglossus semilaevis TaxID=244447 RepID=A0A3P8UF82_CYNSE